MAAGGSNAAAAAAAAPTTYTLLSTHFKAPEFIAYSGPLTDRTVLDYFAQSPFYSKQSTNQMLRMQNIASFTTMIGRWSAKEEEEQLKKFVGTEYVVASAQPPSLFVIHRRERRSPTEATVVAAYYVINDSIMQAPDLYTMLANRLVSDEAACCGRDSTGSESLLPFQNMTTHFISNSLSLARKAQHPIDLRSSTSGGRAWKVYQKAEEEQEAALGSHGAADDQVAGTLAQGDDQHGEDSMQDATLTRKKGDASLKRAREAQVESQVPPKKKEDKRVRIASNVG
jgi:MED6 mediator sub complex component